MMMMTIIIIILIKIINSDIQSVPVRMFEVLMAMSVKIMVF
jgi:hypothetical protein